MQNFGAIYTNGNVRKLCDKKGVEYGGDSWRRNIHKVMSKEKVLIMYKGICNS